MKVRTSVLLDDEDVALSLLPELEKSFGITFGQNDFATAATVGEFVDAAERRIIATNCVDETLRCTGRHVFYRLRQALSETGLPLPSKLLPDTPLSEIFPRKSGRRRQWQQLQEASGLPLSALQVSGWLFLSLWVLLTLGLGIVLAAWGMAILAGLVGTVVACSWSWVRVGFPCATLGELVTQMASQHYIVFNAGIVNTTEMRRIVVAGLASRSVEDEPVTAADLGEATQLKWQSA